MKRKTAAAFLFLLLPVSGFCQEPRGIVNSALTACESPSEDRPGTLLCSSFNTAIQGAPFYSSHWSISRNPYYAATGGTQTPPPARGIPQSNHGKPRLIELTSANWRPLTRKEKLDLFDHDLLHWETHASLAFDAGISAAVGDRPYLGTGAAGYFRKYGMNVADEANFTFFNAYFFPTIFHEDPRYIPFDHGTMTQRVAYALTRILVTRNDAGKSEFNKSEVLGTILATSVSSGYYTAVGAEVGIGGNFASAGINLGSDAAFNLLKEFWPDLARKLKLNVWIRNLVRASIRDRVRVS